MSNDKETKRISIHKVYNNILETTIVSRSLQELTLQTNNMAPDMIIIQMFETIIVQFGEKGKVNINFLDSSKNACHKLFSQKVHKEFSAMQEMI